MKNKTILCTARPARKLPTLLTLVAALLALPLGTRAADIHWTNTLGGNWTDAINWSPNQVPGTNDNPFITAGGTYTVTMYSVAVRNLTVGGPSGTQTVVIPESGLLWLEKECPHPRRAGVRGLDYRLGFMSLWGAVPLVGFFSGLM